LEKKEFLGQYEFCNTELTSGSNMSEILSFAKEIQHITMPTLHICVLHDETLYGDNISKVTIQVCSTEVLFPTTSKVTVENAHHSILELVPNTFLSDRKVTGTLI
jgi:hypothetical protein